MKKALSLLLAVCLLAGALPLSASAAELPFTDVPAKIWYRDDLAYCYENGYIAGSGASTFSPNGKVTRSQFVTFLARVNVVEWLDEDSFADFSDVPATAYYTKYVAWAANQSVVSGDGSGKFNPLDTITREQAAVILANYLDYMDFDLPQLENPVAAFNDAGQVSRWATGAVDVMRRTGLLTGSTDGGFHPKDTMTRAEAAAVIARLARGIEPLWDPLTDYFFDDGNGEELVSFSLPELWRGSFICEIYPGSFWFYSRSNYESGNPQQDGWLFGLENCTDGSWQDYTNASLIRSISVNGQEHDIILYLPDRVRYDDTSAAKTQEYQALAADIPNIVSGLWIADENGAG